MTENQSELNRLPLEWDVPEGLAGLYANNIVVQHTQYEFVVSFFQTFPPLVLGSPEERAAQIEQLDSVKAKCVARIVVSPERMQAFVDVLASNVEQYRARFQNQEDSNGDNGDLS